MEKIIGIYKIENLSSGKCYIGSSTNCQRRLREHRRQLVDGCHPARDMQEDFDKGDTLKATIIERLANGVDRNTLLLHENRYILEYDSIQNGYNKNPACNEELTVKRMRKEDEAAFLSKADAEKPIPRPLEAKKYCSVCGTLISDLDDPGTDYFRHIRLKYCTTCRGTMEHLQGVARVQEYRRRKRAQDKERDTQLALLKEENELLRQRIAALRNDIR
jgi:predicted GIY-YIG superfamily endonuclease